MQEVEQEVKSLNKKSFTEMEYVRNGVPTSGNNTFYQFVKNNLSLV